MGKDHIGRACGVAEIGKVLGWNLEMLSGGWGRARYSLHDRDVTVELTHKSDMLANISGGAARGAVWLINSEAAAHLDIDKLSAWGVIRCVPTT